MTTKVWHISDPVKAEQFSNFVQRLKQENPDLYAQVDNVLFRECRELTVNDSVDCPLSYWEVDKEALRIVCLIVIMKLPLNYRGLTLKELIDDLRGVNGYLFKQILDERHLPGKSWLSNDKLSVLAAMVAPHISDAIDKFFDLLSDI